MNQFFKFVLDLLFPIYCVSCKKEGEWVCSNCIDKYKLNIKDVKSKKNLNELTYIDDIFYFYDFSNEIISKLIHSLKYGYAFDVARFVACNIGDEFYEFIKKFYIENGDFIIIPVPLNKKRFNERGFNQSEIILEKILSFAKISEFSVVNLLYRVVNTKHQVGLSADEREKNLRNAFVINNSLNIDKFIDCNIILFDDVVTTGNTFDECAKILRNFGFKKRIIGLSIAGQR